MRRRSVMGGGVLPGSLFLVAGLTGGPVQAAPEEGAPGGDAGASGSASGSVSLGGGASGDASGEGAGRRRGKRAKRAQDGSHPLLRHRPREGVVELGIYGGLYLPERPHSYVGPGAMQRPLNTVMGSLGGRIGYYPLRWLGFEGELGGFPGSLEDGGYVQLYHARAHALFQLPYRLTPFVLAGGGLVMVNSVASKLGKEEDPAGNFGAGLRFYVNDWFNFRVEWRGSLTPSGENNARPGLHNEVLLGLGFVFGPKQKEAPVAMPEMPKDSDGDGFIDSYDKCPSVQGIPPDGCPSKDRDWDTILNAEDKCPDEPGPRPEGCPVKDRDRDTVPDEKDLCPEEPGLPTDGCPIRDSDGDGILDPDDLCPTEPETRNGFNDTDGCPDEVPKEVEKFTGVIQGIYFDTGKATIQKRSHRVLNQAVEVLKKFPSIKLEISGHTDSKGKDEYNMELSRKRAEAVKEYFVGKGIEESRLVARGAGENEPVATNETREGRAENRRTEFKILQE